MNIYKMNIEQFQVNSKFLNSLSPEWSKFVIDVKLVKDLNTTNFDQLHAYLEQHELHANEVRLMREHSQDPFALVANLNQQTHLTKFPQIDSGLAVPVFKQRDDPIDAINKMMSFLSIVVTSRFPSTNNQLRNSSNPRQQATIHDGRVPVQPLQGRQILMMLCPKPKWKRDATWFREKVLLVEAQGTGKVLNEEELEFLEDPAVQDTNSSAQQDALILTVFEQLSNQVTNCNKVNNDNLIANESLSAELKRYKERVKFLKERQNVDLSTREKLIIDDIIREKNAQFADFEKEINNLKQTLSEQSKEKELLTKTFNVFKNKSKEKEAKNIDTEISLEKKVKELDNIKAQKIRPILYDGNVIAKETNVISIADSEESLMLEEESRSKMLLKQSDPIVLEKKVNTKLIDYAELNRLSEDFGKRFVPQRELSDEQALHPIIDQSAFSPVKIEAPRELPKITPNALTEGECGFEHTKAVFKNEIIPFLKTLKDIFNVFDKDLLNEVTKVQTVFNQMEAAVQQFHDHSYESLTIMCRIKMHKIKNFIDD
ncbi:hypothetical protein Tco_0776424 [Tanacetum coccineum]